MMRTLPYAILFACPIVGSAQRDTTAKPEMNNLSKDCELVVEAINEQAHEKFAQMEAARRLHPEIIAELRELYPIARDAWNSKADWIEKNGPGYSAGFGPLWGDGSEFTTADIDDEVHRFFKLIREASYFTTSEGQGRDLVSDVAVDEEGAFMPRVGGWLRRLKNQCRDGAEEVMKAFNVIRLPELFDDF